MPHLADRWVDAVIADCHDMDDIRDHLRATMGLMLQQRLDAMEGPSAKAFGRMVKFLLATGQRRDECASLKHGDILDRVWKQFVNKSGRPHQIPLPALALDLIGAGEAKDLCFAGRTGKMSGWSKLKRELDKLAGIAPWRLHDCRRTVATGLQDIGIDRPTVKAVLNHSEGDVTATYARSELLSQKRAALARWAEEVERIAGLSPESSLTV